MVFMGNVDAGKTLLLDKIRNTAIASKESGGIAQAIGASVIPVSTITKICSGLISSSAKLKVPGLLTIDTPGHAAFTNLRKRGGNLADIACFSLYATKNIMSGEGGMITTNKKKYFERAQLFRQHGQDEGTIAQAFPPRLG